MNLSNTGNSTKYYLGNFKMSHTYPKGKFEYPSVTTIIGECGNKDALIQWAANATRDYIIDHWEDMQGLGIGECLNAARFDYRRLSKEALEVGSAVHAEIEKILIRYKNEFVTNS